MPVQGTSEEKLRSLAFEVEMGGLAKSAEAGPVGSTQSVGMGPW